MSDIPSMEVDIVCVGFGPAMGGFLSALAPKLAELPNIPQVLCYERADGLGFGVSGVATRARGIRETYPDLDPSQIPMAAPIRDEEMVYLLDPHGASRRSMGMRMADAMMRPGASDHAMTLPWTPAFFHKSGGMVLSIGQFNEWVSQQVMGTGMVQVWPGMPVTTPLIENGAVVGVRLADMEIRAKLTVIGDGPVGSVGRAIDEAFGVPPGHSLDEWAVGAKFVMEGANIEPGKVVHTIGYPEPEIFGFLYGLPDGMASAGIFIPSWFENPVRTSYRYLQHFITHPYMQRYLSGAKLRSWGAKSLLEAGRRGEPWLVGNGYARIGEGTGSTNVLTGSGVDEAWTTGTQLAQSVLELWQAEEPFTQANLHRTYVSSRRRSWVEKEGHIAENARNGFTHGVLRGLIGMGLAGMSGGGISLPRKARRKDPSIEEYFAGRIPAEDIAQIRADAAAGGQTLHDRLMDRAGWPAIALDGQLLVSHQDALLIGGKVQGSPGAEDHVRFLHRELCETCHSQVCTEICSGEAIAPVKDGGAPAFDREKCVHCGACMWNCENIAFSAAAGGLHSAEN